MPTETAKQTETGPDWTPRPAAADGPPAPAHRPVRVAGLTGYLDPIGVKPGETLGGAPERPGRARDRGRPAGSLRAAAPGARRRG
jgi:hypothetical protein